MLEMLRVKYSHTMERTLKLKTMVTSGEGEEREGMKMGKESRKVLWKG